MVLFSRRMAERQRHQFLASHRMAGCLFGIYR
jgi:hypothetical protein